MESSFIRGMCVGGWLETGGPWPLLTLTSVFLPRGRAGNGVYDKEALSCLCCKPGIL